MFKKNRTQERKPLSKFGFIQMLGDDGGQILNISETGLCFATFAPLGQVKNVHFWFSLNLRDRIDATGEIAWLDSETKAGGLRFQDLSERALKHIRTYSTGFPPKESREKGRFFAAALAKLDPRGAIAKFEPTHLDSVPAFISRSEDSHTLLPRDFSFSDKNQPGSGESTDLISLQRHLAVCRRQRNLGILIGILFTSAIAVPIAGYVGHKNRIDTPAPTIATSTQEAAKPEPELAQTSLPATSGPSPLNVSAPMNAQRSAVLHSYPNSSINGASRSISPISSSPFSEGNRRPSTTSKAAQPREAEATVVKKSSASPQQLWSAVQAGDTNAAVVLADRYLRGDGVPVNCVQARVLLLAASEKKNPNAIKKLHELDSNGCS